MREREGRINSVRRMSPGGATAYEYHSRLPASLQGVSVDPPRLQITFHPNFNL